MNIQECVLTFVRADHRSQIKIRCEEGRYTWHASLSVRENNLLTSAAGPSEELPVKDHSTAFNYAFAALEGLYEKAQINPKEMTEYMKSV